MVFHRDSVLGAFVVSLLFLSGPPDVPRFVIAIVIDAINCETWWTLSNVREEVDKAIPTFADFDASRAIPLIIILVGVIAALVHVFPCTVKIVRSLSRRVAVAVSTTIASAGPRVAAAKVGKTGDMMALAVATTKPERVSVNILAGGLDCNQSTEPHASNIYAPGHRSAPIGSRSSGGPMLKQWPAAHSIIGGCYRSS
jgi:hypothetical protein